MRIKGLIAVTLVVLMFSPAFAGDKSQQKTVPLFTDEDLEKYGSKPIADPELIDRIRRESPFPTEPPADADRIFKENSRAVVVVVAFNKEGVPFSHGSGFFVRKDGVLVTSYHVISNAADIKVKAGGKVLHVEGLLYADKENDIAILKVKGETLNTVRLGNSDGVDMGDKVYVISSPQGAESKMSEGILRGIKELGPHRRALQITAPLSPGSSGGPVFNKNNEVIGIATFIVKEAFTHKEVQNLNFAVPVNLIKDKISTKKVTPLKDVWTEDHTQSADYWFIHGNNLYKSGRYTDAVDAYKKALAINPDLAGALNGLGVAYMKLNKYKEAVGVYQQALRIEPDSAWVYSNLGFAYIKLGKNKEAIGALTQAIRIMPDLVVAHYNLGIAYSELKMYREAIEAYKKAVGINPDFAEAHYGLGLAYLDLKDKNAAMEEYRILKNLDPALAEKLSKRIYR